MNIGIKGAKGEAMVARFLRNKGFSVVARNYQCRYGEIDIIAEDGECVIFVEVKTRSDGMKYSPSDAVNSTKRAKIIASSQIYLKNYVQMLMMSGYGLWHF